MDSKFVWWTSNHTYFKPFFSKFPNAKQIVAKFETNLMIWCTNPIKDVSRFNNFVDANLKIASAFELGIYFS